MQNNRQFRTIILGCMNGSENGRKENFPSDFDSMKIWEEALDEKYDYECSIALMKRDNFDYTVWQREYFDKMESGEFAANAFEYAKSHPYMGKGEIL